MPRGAHKYKEEYNKLFTGNLKLPDFWPKGTIGCFAVLPDTLAPLRKQIAKSVEFPLLSVQASERYLAIWREIGFVGCISFVLNCRDIESILPTSAQHRAILWQIAQLKLNSCHGRPQSGSAGLTGWRGSGWYQTTTQKNVTIYYTFTIVFFAPRPQPVPQKSKLAYGVKILK